MKERFDLTSLNVSSERIADLISKWKENSIRLNNMILSDARKEFDANSMISFGLDGDETVKKSDFENVRGSYDENSFVKGLLKDNEEIEQKV